MVKMALTFTLNILIELGANRIEQKYIICDTDLVNNDFFRF